MSARTIASWIQHIAHGPGPADLDVLVPDEAAMADDRSVARLLTEAARTGTEGIADGDQQRLQAIGPGCGFAEVHTTDSVEQARTAMLVVRDTLHTRRPGSVHEKEVWLRWCGGVLRVPETARRGVRSAAL